MVCIYAIVPNGDVLVSDTDYAAAALAVHAIIDDGIAVGVSVHDGFVSGEMSFQDAISYLESRM